MPAATLPTKPYLQISEGAAFRWFLERIEPSDERRDVSIAIVSRLDFGPGGWGSFPRMVEQRGRERYGYRVILASLEWQPMARKDATMADDSMSLPETLRELSAEGEVTELTGVAEGVRHPERRLTHRNGSAPARKLIKRRREDDGLLHHALGLYQPGPTCSLSRGFNTCSLGCCQRTLDSAP
jgi:hypothetical protein